MNLKAKNDDKLYVTIEWLIDHAADPNAQSAGKSHLGEYSPSADKVQLPLGFAIDNGDLPLVKFLLAKGADPNMTDMECG